jgi:hypothetical protein
VLLRDQIEHDCVQLNCQCSYSKYSRKKSKSKQQALLLQKDFAFLPVAPGQ